MWWHREWREGVSAEWSSTLGADSALAIRHPRQRDVQTSGPLSQPRCGETRQLLMLHALREIEEVATHGIGGRHRGLVL